jgi:hypothetical protein
MRINVTTAYADGKKQVEIFGTSSETKPTIGICDGSIFCESDTGDVYFFSESSGEWVKQFSFQG